MKFNLEFHPPSPNTTDINCRKPMIRIKIDPTNAAITNPNFAWSNLEYSLALVDTGADYCVFDTETFSTAALTPIPGVNVSATQTGDGTQRNEKPYRMAILLPDQRTVIGSIFVPLKFNKLSTCKIIIGMSVLRHGTLCLFKGANAGYFKYNGLLPS